MKVVALGAAGEMGRWAARTLLDNPLVHELVVADLDGAAAARLAQSLGPRARAIEVDVRDTAALQALLIGADLLMNTVGPFFRFGVPILQAAIAARCHYIDICDDWEPTLDMLALSDQACNAGVCAVIGMGASPGLTNLAAVQAAAALDVVTAVYTGWSLDGASASVPQASASPTTSKGTGRHQPSAATVHGVHQMSGRIRVREAGVDQMLRPLQRHALNYPGLGRQAAWSIGHPEAVTLPRHLGPHLQTCVNVMVSRPTDVGLLRLMRSCIDRRWLSVHRAARWLEEAASWSRAPLPQPWGAEPADTAAPTTLPPLFALACGEHDGQPAQAAVAFTSGPVGGVGAVTGIPLAMGASWLLNGLQHGAAKVPRGVFAPESVIPPDELFHRLRPYCHPSPASVDDLALLSTSWQATPLAQQVREVRQRAHSMRP